jgi:hypothetical protein
VFAAPAGYVSGGNVMKVPLAGGLPTQVASGYLFGQPALGATSVLYIATSVSSDGGGDAIVSIPLSGGPSTTLATLPRNVQLGRGLGTDGMFVYFDDSLGLQAAPVASDSGTAGIVTVSPSTPTDAIGVFGQTLVFTLPQGQIESVPLPPLANAPVTMLANTGAAAVDLASCGSNACWLDLTDNALELMSPLGGPISRLALIGSLALGYHFAFDGVDFYVIGGDLTMDTLAKVPRDGSCPNDLVHMPPAYSRAVAVDDECVYWSSTAGIFSLAKSAEGPFRQ